jgi:predicted unusual protein kinase regulating ubiquinone biosynthesis (AarF/ABC1/UbiB family)
MTASVAGNLAKTRVKSLFQSEVDAAASREVSNRESGNRIAQTLGELKGAVMKVGQMASIAQDVLPKELADALGKLQREAPPVDYAVIAEQVERELGSAPELLFSRFDPTPFAAASIGQVHRATTDDGRDVVVKVQYPGVEDAVDSDLAQLKLALRASGIVNIGRAALNASFTEVRKHLHEELDYTNEADNVRLFREFHLGKDAQGKVRHDFMVLPEVVGERSSKRVLTLSYEGGDQSSDLQSLGYTQAQRDALGRNLFHMLCSQVFELGILHADPNPGNFAFRPDGKIVLYDFGCAKRLRLDIIVAYKDLIEKGIAENWDAVDDALLRLEVRRPDGPRPDDGFYKSWRDTFADPFLDIAIFDYGRSTLHDEVVKLIPASIKRMGSFQPATELIFLDRTVVGHYGNMRTLAARVPSYTFLKRYLDAFPGEFVARPAAPPPEC